MRKKLVRKLTFVILAGLILCTGLSRQIQQMTLPQVCVAPVERGKLTHELTCPVIWEPEEKGLISWQIADDEAYGYFRDVKDVNINWVDAYEQEQTQVFPILDKRQEAEGTWYFYTDITELLSSSDGIDISTMSAYMKNIREYDYTVPLTALSLRGKEHMVFTVAVVPGIFSEEQTVQCWPVNVLDMDASRAAITSGQYGEVVTYTSKPLSDQMRVSLVP